MTEIRTIDPARLAGVRELADLFGVARTTISNWAARASEINFPEPVASLAATPVWDVQEVVTWYGGYVPNKGGRPGTTPSRDQLGRYIKELTPTCDERP